MFDNRVNPHRRAGPFRRANYSLLLVATLIAGGCQLPKATVEFEPPPPETSDLGRVGNWNTPFGRLGLVPVLPQSEDVRVGDVFVYPFNPDMPMSAERRARSGGLGLIPRWTSLDLIEELEAEYRARPAWPATPDAFLQRGTIEGPREWAEPGSENGASIFDPENRPQRLRSFGIPEFSIASTSEGDVNSLVPTEAINLVLGSAWNDEKVISIRMNSAETYSLSMQKIIDIAFNRTSGGAVLKSPYRDHLDLMGDPASDRIWMRLLSDVVYVRSIDFTIQSPGGFDEDEGVVASEFVSDVEETSVRVEEQADGAVEGGDDAGDAQADGGEGAKAPADDGEVVMTETVTETAPDHVLDPAYAAFVRANAINELLIEANADVLPGGFIRFISITENSITLRRVWQRGLAVGMRGMTLEGDKDTGVVVRAATMGSLRP